MKTEKLDFELTTFAETCKNAGQGGLISCGIAQGIRATQTQDIIFWTAYNLIDSLSIEDFEKLKVFSEVCSNKISDILDNFTNKESDNKKASILARIDFKRPNALIQEIH